MTAVSEQKYFVCLQVLHSYTIQMPEENVKLRSSVTASRKINMVTLPCFNTKA